MPLGLSSCLWLRALCRLLLTTTLTCHHCRVHGGRARDIVMRCSHEEETQWNECLVDAVAAAGCGNLTKSEIAQFCGSPINSNSTICPVRPCA